MTIKLDRREILGGAALAATAATLAGAEERAPSAGADLTVHVLDIYTGTPAHGVTVELFMKKDGQTVLLKSVATGPDGRPEGGAMLAGEAFAVGRYLITFDLSDYFKALDKALPANFFRKVSMEFEITDPRLPLHVPLQCTPWTQACSVLPNG